MKRSFVKPAYVGILTGATGREEIRAGFDENSKIHKIFKNPLIRANVGESPPFNQTFIDLTNKPPRSEDERFRSLEESQRQMMGRLEESMSRYDEMLHKHEALEKNHAITRQELQEAKILIKKGQYYNDLMTTKDLSAYNLLEKHLWRRLDALIVPSINFCAANEKHKSQRKVFLQTLKKYRGNGNKRYKALLEAEKKGGVSYKKVLDRVEIDYLKEKGMEEVISVKDFRAGMNRVLRRLRDKRIAGAHSFDVDGLLEEDRKLVLADIKASIQQRDFHTQELEDERVLKLLALACDLEEKELGGEVGGDKELAGDELENEEEDEEDAGGGEDVVMEASKRLRKE